jgi:hypothetical protein
MQRWQLGRDGGIVWHLEDHSALPHRDHLAMSGRNIDMILEWEVNGSGVFHATRVIRWPMLRTIPNDTHASLELRIDDHQEPGVVVNGRPLPAGQVAQVAIWGALEVVSRCAEGVEWRRTIFPAVAAPAIFDLVELTNLSGKPLGVQIPRWRVEQSAATGVRGVYHVEQFLIGETDRCLAPGEALRFAIVRTAQLAEDAPYIAEAECELAARLRLRADVEQDLVLETPEPVLNRMFALAKLRTVESIFATRGGLMHAPGGYHRYLAAIWANDQAEYANPFFPFLGNPIGNESALNAFRHFARFMNPQYRPIPSSIIAEGVDVWQGAGDRGDQAMIAYGAARFALAAGNRAWAEELWPLIAWCLEYCRRQTTADGVIASDSDELEGRFPAGAANLCTSALTYDALLRAAHLARDLGLDNALVQRYHSEAQALHAAICRYFEAEVEGFATYRYYAGNEVLRSWICIPLAMGITDRLGGTTQALFSARLWTGNGLLTQSGEHTYWDRSTLYALRGVLFCGELDTALPKLLDYSRERLLGSHVPYAVEAYPEGNQSQLSAESALYCRIFSEGLFGIQPAGLRYFTCTPRLPAGWQQMALRRVQAFGCTWDIHVARRDDLLAVTVTDAAGVRLYEQALPAGVAHFVDVGKGE